METVAGILGILCCFCVWALLYKRFFGNKSEFIKSAKLIFTQYRYLQWSSNNEFEKNMGALLKVYAWFVLGCLSGYLLRFAIVSLS